MHLIIYAYIMITSDTFLKRLSLPSHSNILYRNVYDLLKDTRMIYIHDISKWESHDTTCPRSHSNGYCFSFFVVSLKSKANKKVVFTVFYLGFSLKYRAKFHTLDPLSLVLQLHEFWVNVFPVSYPIVLIEITWQKQLNKVGWGGYDGMR